MFQLAFQGLEAGHRCDGCECYCLYHQLLLRPCQSTDFSRSQLCTIKIELPVLLHKSFYHLKEKSSSFLPLPLLNTAFLFLFPYESTCTFTVAQPSDSVPRSESVRCTPSCAQHCAGRWTGVWRVTRPTARKCLLRWALVLFATSNNSNSRTGVISHLRST